MYSILAYCVDISKRVQCMTVRSLVSLGALIVVSAFCCLERVRGASANCKDVFVNG